MQLGEAFVISVAVEEEHHASDVVVHATPPVALRHFLKLLHADTVVLGRSLKNALCHEMEGGESRWRVGGGRGDQGWSTSLHATQIRTETLFE